MKIAFQMERMEETDPQSTNSLLMIAEARRRGHGVFHYAPETLSLENGGVYANVAEVWVDLAETPHYTLGNYHAQRLNDFDIIFMRQHPPFDINYITATYLLEQLEAEGVLVTNNASAIRNNPEKLAIFKFPHFIAPTLVSRDVEAVAGFLDRHGELVVKPLHEFFGRGIIRISQMKEAEEALASAGQPLMFQPFLPAIREGNKRIVLFGGEVAGALITVPPEGEFRVYRNSTDHAYELNARDREICDAVGAICKEQGLHFVGIDIIGDYLTEINVTCTGSLMRLNKIYGKRFEEGLLDAVEAARHALA